MRRGLKVDVCSCLQLGQLREAAGVTQVGEEMVADDATGELIKIGAKVVRHSRFVALQMAEVAVPGTLLREILARIAHIRAGPALAMVG